MLNYAYAVKPTHVQIDAVANGYDPMLGIMHSGRKGSPGWLAETGSPPNGVYHKARTYSLR